MSFGDVENFDQDLIDEGQGHLVLVLRYKYEDDLRVLRRVGNREEWLIAGSERSLLSVRQDTCGQPPLKVAESCNHSGTGREEQM
jgi:hypothetical protein